jgi:hypothetical protein
LLIKQKSIILREFLPEFRLDCREYLWNTNHFIVNGDHRLLRI